MKINRLITLIAIAGVMLACNLPTAAGPGGAGPAEVSATPTTASQAAATETATPAPANTPTITPTPTPSEPMVTPLKDAVNCRFGLGVEYEPVGALAVGNTVPILGKSSDGGWWQIQNPAGSDKCWVAASVTIASGDLSKVPVVAPPSAFVTNVYLQIKPDSISVPGCMGPIMPSSFKGSIQVNGPVKVKWHFESEQGGSMSEHTTNFTSFGSKDVSTDYTPPLTEGNYWVRLVVTFPNSMTAEANYKIKCP